MRRQASSPEQFLTNALKEFHFSVAEQPANDLRKKYSTEFFHCVATNFCILMKTNYQEMRQNENLLFGSATVEARF